MDLETKNNLIKIFSIILIIDIILNLIIKNLNFFQITFSSFLVIFISYITNILFDEIEKYFKIYKNEDLKDNLKQIIIILFTISFVLIPSIYLLELTLNIIQIK